MFITHASSSSFGSGAYRAFSISRNLGEGFHMEVLGGESDFHLLAGG